MGMLSRKSCITLVEVLVVIGIIVFLITLALPAIQMAREAARRSNCTNNLKEIGLGLLSYENKHKYLPGSAEVVKSDAQRPVGGWSFLFKILPQMEYDTIYNSIDPKEIKGTIADSHTVVPLTTMGINKAICTARDTQIGEFSARAIAIKIWKV